MEAYFSTNSDQVKKRPVAMGDISPGLPCCSVYDSVLYRAVVRDVDYVANAATVKFVDYGNVEVVKLEEVYELAEEYAEACVGAVCCRVEQVLVETEAAEAFREGAQEWREELYKASKDGRLFVVLKKKVGSEGSVFV
jgi:hypothetical protein